MTLRLLPTLLLFLVPLAAQEPIDRKTSSSSSSAPTGQVQESTSRARIAQPEAGGAAVTLETSEPLFNLAVALNACGYDTDLASSNPIRLLIRQEINDELQSSAPARDARDAVCTYIREHTLTDKALDLAQYISLALYTLPPPALTPSVGETELPPDAAQIVNILTPLRTFSEQLHLHALWVEHLPAYQTITDKVHDPLTKSILNTNVYLRLPASSYDGRRFLVLLEPMLAPSSTNARIYASDYIAVGSPSGADGSIHMDQVRHIYLQYMIEPLIYSRAAAMDRLLPLLKPVTNAPIDFIYKSDITALITECLIRAVEARTLTFNFPRPVRPTSPERAEQFKYDGDLAAYDKKTEALRRELVDKDMRQGWALTAYFYDQLLLTEHDSASLKEDIGQMVYGMDVDRERKRETQIAFLPEGANSGIRRTPQPITGVRLAELDLMKGKLPEAEDLAQKILEDPRGDHPEAHYVLGQVNILQRDPDEAIEHFDEAIKTSKNPRTLAWSHIYLGRLYDTQHDPDRPKAIAEYKAALTVRDSAPDTKAAAEKGLKAPFTGPKRTVKSTDEEDDNTPFDPSGKAEKEAYRPTTPQ